MFIKKILLLLVSSIVLFFATATMAQASTEQARQFVTELSSRTLAIIQNKDLQDPEKEKQLTTLFTDTLDTKWIGRFALGRYARTMTPEQKARYNTAYTQFLILNYVPSFREYTGQTLTITSISAAGENAYLVQTKIVNPGGGASIRVDYRLRQKGETFKVYDIIAEGVSLIATQRSEFGSILSQQGIESLIGKLEARVKDGAATNGSK